MFKILSISSLFPHASAPNFGVFVANRLRAMQLSGDIDITLVTPFPDSPAHRHMPRYKKSRNTGPLHEIDSGGFNRYNVPYLSIPGMFKHIEYLSFLRWAKKNADQIWRMHGPFDAIDVHWGYPDLPVAQYLAKKWQIPLNMTLRGMETFYIGDSRERLVSKALEQCDGIVSLSEQMLSHVNTHQLPTHCKQSVIINGADPKKFGFADVSDSRAKLGIPEEQLVLLGVGSLIYRKGFHCVITAIADLIAEHPELHYYIIGSELAEVNFPDKLKALCKELGVTEHVHFVGPVLNKELNTWYNASDWFVLSSAGEGSPNVLSESLMSGCPAIVTPVGAAPDLMKLSIRSGHIFPEQTLNVFDNNSVEAMDAWRSTLHELFSKTPKLSPRERKMLSNDMASYDWSWCAKKTIAHLDSVIREHSCE